MYNPARLHSAEIRDASKHTDHEKWPKANNEILRKHFTKK